MRLVLSLVTAVLLALLGYSTLGSATSPAPLKVIASAVAHTHHAIVRLR
jgi:hypothetical protein